MARAERGQHLVHRVGWLRAAVLGANDGIISTSSLLVGLATADIERPTILLTGLASLIAGALSMAAGEYVSVSSQADVERADFSRESQEHVDYPEEEAEELAALYRDRGLTPELAREVAAQLMRVDPVAAHLRDELGITDVAKARPIQAAFASAATFLVGAIFPLLAVMLAPREVLAQTIVITSMIMLAVLGAVGARAGGAGAIRGALRVGFWGAAAMALTALVGNLFGTGVVG